MASLLVSELVTNVILHTGSTAQLLVQFDRVRVRVEVQDADSRPPVRRKRAPTAATGRGLVLVETLATAWGWAPVEDGKGKVVWFELAPEAAALAHPAGTTAHRSGGDEPAPQSGGRGGRS